MTPIVVLTTVGSAEEGERIARELVGRQHAACVNLVAGVKSFYRWQGEICSDDEQLLVIKSTRSEFEALSAAIQELHSYDLPEILALSVDRGEPGFVEWIEENTGADVIQDRAD